MLKFRVLSLLTAVAVLTHGIQPLAIAVESEEVAQTPIDLSHIIHEPQEYIQPDSSILSPFYNFSNSFSSSFSTNSQDSQYSQYEVGSTRSFHLSRLVYNSNAYRTVQGNLLAQGEHVNIWILDHADYHSQDGVRACGGHCTLGVFTSNMASAAATEFDAIYEAMTDETTGFAPHANVVITTNISNMPLVGDIDDDGRANILLYDINDDGRRAGSSAYTAGFFTNGDFFTAVGNQPMNNLDMFHMDIGSLQGANAFLPNATNEAKSSFYGTFAHEFQHMLFYMYYGVYAPVPSEVLWINETLAELAHTFYAQPGTEITDISRLIMSSHNDYSLSSSDFLNFGNEAKSYGMAAMFGLWLNKSHDGFARQFYAYFESEFPIANTSVGFSANRNKTNALGGARTVLGNALESATGRGNGGNDTVREVYFAFVEAFAADGGLFYSKGLENVETSTQLSQMYTLSEPAYNLWAIRPVMGVSNGRLFFTHEDTVNGLLNASHYNLSNTQGYVPIPTLDNNGSISLNGTRERFFRLSPSASTLDEPVLNITIPNTATGDSMYYVVVPQDELLVNANAVRATGESGADVYRLTKGQPNRINTMGKHAYLYVASFESSVGAVVDYDWESPITLTVTGDEIQVHNFSGTPLSTKGFYVNDWNLPAIVIQDRVSVNLADFKRGRVPFDIQSVEELYWGILC